MIGLSRLQRIGIAAALSVAFSQTACGLQDHPGSSSWTPFESIAGPLKPESQNFVAPPATMGTTLRIVTYNLHMVPDMAALVSALQGNAQLAKADVFLFEEIESHPQDGKSQAAILAEALGMNYAYAPAWAYADGGTHGLACLSHFPISEPQVLYLPYDQLGGASEQRIAMRATLSIGSKTLRTIGLHLDTKLNVNDRLKQLYPAIQLADPDTILGGDFNSNPWIWVDRTLPLLPVQAVAPVDPAKAIDDVMTYNGFSAPTSTSGTTTNLPMFNARLDSIYTRGYTPAQFGLERSVTTSDHFPVWVDIARAP